MSLRTGRMNDNGYDLRNEVVYARVLYIYFHTFKGRCL